MFLGNPVFCLILYSSLAVAVRDKILHDICWNDQTVSAKSTQSCIIQLHQQQQQNLNLFSEAVQLGLGLPLTFFFSEHELFQCSSYYWFFYTDYSTRRVLCPSKCWKMLSMFEIIYIELIFWKFIQENTVNINSTQHIHTHSTRALLYSSFPSSKTVQESDDRTAGA